MFKLKREALVVSRHEALRFFFSASSAALTGDPFIQPLFHQEGEANSGTQKRESPESDIRCSLNCKFFISSLLNCKDTSQIRQVHTQIVINGMFQNLLVLNKLLYMHARYKAIADADVLFVKMPERDAVSWSVMAGGFAKAGDYSKCFTIFGEMIRCGLRPDNYTLPSVTRACRDSADLQLGILIHHVVHKFGMKSDPFVSAALVDMYAKCGEIEDAQKLFDKMPERDLVTWTVMIGASGECGNAKESLILFDQMRHHGVVPDKVAMVTVVNAYARLGALQKARVIHDYIQNRNFSLDVILGTAMIDMYAKCEVLI